MLHFCCQFSSFIYPL